jgi:hypothetical protein
MAIEEKRSAHSRRRNPSSPRVTRRPSQSVQGRAFAAPRMQSLDRMRSRAEDVEDLDQALDQSPRKHSLRHLNSVWDYHTPPSNRKGRIVGDGEAADIKDRLRRVRSNATIGSKTNLHRESSVRSRRGTTSALGFREAEVREDMELAGLGDTGEAQFKSRLDQYRFSKKKSMERWRGVANVGVGWLKGNGGTKEGRDRDGWV